MQYYPSDEKERNFGKYYLTIDNNKFCLYEKSEYSLLSNFKKLQQEHILMFFGELSDNYCGSNLEFLKFMVDSFNLGNEYKIAENISKNFSN